MEIQVGDKDVKVDWIVELGEFFDVRSTDEDEVFLKPKRAAYTAEELKRVVVLIHDLEPDECSVDEGGEVRLWWD